MQLTHLNVALDGPGSLLGFELIIHNVVDCFPPRNIVGIYVRIVMKRREQISNSESPLFCASHANDVSGRAPQLQLCSCQLPTK